MEKNMSIFKHTGTAQLHNFAAYIDRYKLLYYEAAKAEHDAFAA